VAKLPSSTPPARASLLLASNWHRTIQRLGHLARPQRGHLQNPNRKPSGRRRGRPAKRGLFNIRPVDGPYTRGTYELKPHFIILDEFHRCGAEQWGKGVDALLKTYPDVPILGLSATNIRYLDNQRDMADELFDNHIASEMTLGEAISRGILAAPKYITTVYKYKKELNKYEKRIRKAKSPGHPGRRRRPAGKAAPGPGKGRLAWTTSLHGICPILRANTWCSAPTPNTWRR